MTRPVLKVAFFVISLTATTALAAKGNRLEPVQEYRGGKLRELQNRQVEAAKTLAFSGQGHRAAETLRSTIELNPQSTAGQSALDLLKEWGLEKDDLKDQERVNTVVRSYLDNQFAAMSDMAQIETLIALHHPDEAGNRLVSMLKRNIRGEQLSRSISRFLRRWGISEDGSALSAGQLPSSEIHARLQKGISIKTFLEQTEFLQAVEPESGKQMSRMLRELHPEVAWIENAANERDESESGDPRMNFFRRGFPPGVISPNFGRIFGGGGGRFPFGGEEENRDPNSSNREATTNEEPLSFDQVSRNLRLIGSSDSQLAKSMLELTKAYFEEAAKSETLMALQSKIEASNKARIPKALSLPSSEFIDADNDSDELSPIFNGDEIPTYSIQLSNENYERLKALPKEYVSGTFSDGQITLENVGVRLKGSLGSFRNLDPNVKSGFTVKFNQFVPGQRYRGVKRIILNNGVQDSTFLHEWMAYSLFRRAGLPAARVGHANLILNGQDAGFHIQVEAITKDFLKRWFDKASGETFEGPSDITNWENIDADSADEEEARERLANLSEAAEKALGEGSLKPLDELIETTSFARYLALEILLDHWDGYLQTNNYRIYRDPESGRYFFLPHGADQTLNNPNGDIFREVRGVVAQAFFATDEGKNLFMDEMENILATVWHPATNRSRLKVRYETIRPHVLNDSLYGRSISDFDRDVAQTATFFGERQRMARWQLMAEFDPLLKRNIESLISGSGPFGNRNRGGGRRGGGFRGR